MRDITTLAPVPADEKIPYGDHPDQFFAVWKASGDATAIVIVIHGGFWRARYNLWHTSHMCAALARAGITTASLEYRRAGWPITFDDVQLGVAAAARHLGAQPVVVGHSAGGHLALLLAAHMSGIRAVVPLAPVADLRRAFELNLSNGAVKEFLGGTPEAVPRVFHAADPVYHAPLVPATLIHGTADDIVPIELSRNFVENHKGGKVKLIELAAGHFDLIDPQSSAWPEVLNITRSLFHSSF